jgi:hypothetical protein
VDGRSRVETLEPENDMYEFSWLHSFSLVSSVWGGISQSLVSEWHSLCISQSYWMIQSLKRVNDQSWNFQLQYKRVLVTNHSPLWLKGLFCSHEGSAWLQEMKKSLLPTVWSMPPKCWKCVFSDFILALVLVDPTKGYIHNKRSQSNWGHH